jgi:hypothetical protein
MAQIGPELGSWRLISLAMLRARVVPISRKGAAPGWTGVVEYRARLLRALD